MKEFEIVPGNNGKELINYYENDVLVTTELYSQPGFVATIKDGYKDRNAPNWYGLEQGLFKSSLFSKYIMDYNSKGLLLTTVLQNGKKGESVDEQTLLMGFGVLQIAFENEEKDVINNLLIDNKFSIQL